MIVAGVHDAAVDDALAQLCGAVAGRRRPVRSGPSVPGKSPANGPAWQSVQRPRVGSATIASARRRVARRLGQRRLEPLPDAAAPAQSKSARSQAEGLGRDRRIPGARIVRLRLPHLGRRAHRAGPARALDLGRAGRRRRVDPGHGEAVIGRGEAVAGVDQLRARALVSPRSTASMAAPRPWPARWPRRPTSASRRRSRHRRGRGCRGPASIRRSRRRPGTSRSRRRRRPPRRWPPARCGGITLATSACSSSKSVTRVFVAGRPRSTLPPMSTGHPLDHAGIERRPTPPRTAAAWRRSPWRRGSGSSTPASRPSGSARSGSPARRGRAGSGTGWRARR